MTNATHMTAYLLAIIFYKAKKSWHLRFFYNFTWPTLYSNYPATQITPPFPTEHPAMYTPWQGTVDMPAFKQLSKIIRIVSWHK